MEDKKLDKPKPIRKIPNKRIAPKPPKFNFMWLYAVAIAAFVGVALYSNNNASTQIDFKQFENEMLKPGDVDYVEAYKTADYLIAEVHIKKDSLNKPRYADVKKHNNVLVQPGTKHNILLLKDHTKA
ncbi:hypothetical protein HK413_02925 [Mucilaginibacter sp. S1162]|uniref:Peptidase M41 FtsH extracellular domain-containing protein n=1 Tax=Mucilaginibacter humi TaxID=2732510 RepID=A0ABX1VZK7_9SPHI|nr:hypothetical protein [Mucilaginibacter humi]